jgi:hypothetical protein
MLTYIKVKRKEGVMVSLSLVEDQLRQAGYHISFWQRPEVRELPHILMDGETIQYAVGGRYAGGIAFLCVTNHRLLLVDRKLMFLSLEDIRFDMIVELDYSSQWINGTIHIITPTRKLTFVSRNQDRLRALLRYAQQRVTEIRQNYHMEDQFQETQRRQNNPQAMAGLVGGTAMQGNNGAGMNPYLKVPILTHRQERYSRFAS